MHLSSTAAVPISTCSHLSLSCLFILYTVLYYNSSTTKKLEAPRGRGGLRKFDVRNKDTRDKESRSGCGPCSADGASEKSGDYVYKLLMRKDFGPSHMSSMSKLDKARIVTDPF